jgi:hypothetical protein
VVAVMLLSWLVITNHCALGRLQQATAPHAHCHATKGDTSKPAPGNGMRECCQAMKASVSGALVLKVKLVQLELAPYIAPAELVTPVVAPTPAIFLDHGPPGGAVSFAEIVLQRSLLSHAPPVRA